MEEIHGCKKPGNPIRVAVLTFQDYGRPKSMSEEDLNAWVRAYLDRVLGPGVSTRTQLVFDDDNALGSAYHSIRGQEKWEGAILEAFENVPIGQGNIAFTFVRWCKAKNELAISATYHVFGTD